MAMQYHTIHFNNTEPLNVATRHLVDFVEAMEDSAILVFDGTWTWGVFGEYEFETMQPVQVNFKHVAAVVTQ